ncbi:MAG: hypothetical protein AWM53_00400 [Candidatus Dichloromethanomonas elyunquensis]|nr:MAG: hypothetical protein AWM53_00400 [Candidatus Dichloromethanomonas elyunquensis]
MSNLTVLEHQSQRVLTTQQLAEVYETNPNNIIKNFGNNSERFQEGRDFYRLEGEQLQEFKRQMNNVHEPWKFASSLFLWTQRGANRHCKILDTDQAWQQFDILEETYFKVRQLKPLSVLDALAQTVQVLQEQNARILQLESTTQAIKDTIITQPDNWRDDLNKMFNKIALSIGDNKFRDLRTESYKLLEQRARVDLTRRLINHRSRLLEQGSSKTVIEKANKLDVIEQDTKLREIYAQIIKEYFIKHCA